MEQVVEVALGAAIIGIVVSAWVKRHRKQVGRAVQDIVTAIDPLITPPQADIPEGVDEIHAPGHAHVKRGR